MINIIVAYNKNFVIGDKTGKIPWYIKDDLLFFKKTTMGFPCIMGRKTWESLPDNFKPLKGRKNIIVSKTLKNVHDDVVILDSIESSIEYAKSISDNFYIIGGGEIYKYAINKNLVDRVIASEVIGYEDVEGSVFFEDLSSLGFLKFKLEEFKEFSVFEYYV